jgi:3-oxoadipate enol-lactonase
MLRRVVWSEYQPQRQCHNVSPMPKSRLRYLEATPAAGVRPLGTLVLLHAFPLSARMWEPQFTLADDGWRIIAPHLPGMDGGPGETPITSFDDAAGQVIDLLDSLHIDEAVIGGLSMGGYLTFALFRHAARYFRGMVLADTRPQADTPEAKEGRARMQALLAEKGPAGVADEMMPKLLAPETIRVRPNIVERVRALILANPPEAIAAAITALMTRSDSTALLSKIQCPTLIIVGDTDALTPPALSREMQRAIAGSELVTIEDAGHLSSLERPVQFNAALARFLEQRV